MKLIPVMSVIVVGALLAVMSTDSVAQPSAKPVDAESVEALPSAEAPELAQSAAPVPTVERTSARQITVTGADYASITPRADIVTGFGEIVDLASIVVAMGDGTPIIFQVDADLDYEIHAAVRWVPDGDTNFTTEYTNHSVIATRIDRVQALVLLIMEKGVREQVLGDVTFFEFSEAMNRIRDEAVDPPVESALDEQ